MSLTDRIEQLQKDIKHYGEAIEEARKELWQANYVRRHDARRKGESEEHWKLRRQRNRERYEHRDEVVETLVKKRRALEKSLEDLKEHRKEFREEQAEARSQYEKGSTKIVVMDGKSIVEDLAYWLDKARDSGWHGVVVSGYRTPEYSQSLCYNMCGAPACPGKCAGMASNHAKTTYPGPAADVTDYYNCETVLARIGAPYWNDLPYDPVHMSRSGR